MKKILSVVALGLAVSAARAEAGHQEWQPASIRRVAALLQAAAPPAVAAIPVANHDGPAPSPQSLIADFAAFGNSYSRLVAAAELHRCELACGIDAHTGGATASSTAPRQRPPRLTPPEGEVIGHSVCSDFSHDASIRPARREPLPLGSYLSMQFRSRTGIDASPALAEAKLQKVIAAVQSMDIRFRRNTARIVAGSRFSFEVNPFEAVEPAAKTGPTRLAASPVEGRALLDEYHAYDLTLNDRLWLSHARSTICESSDVAVHPKPAFPGGRQPVAGFVIAKLPIEKSWTTSHCGEPAADQFVDAAPSVVFGPHVAPSVDLHLRGLAWVAEDCRATCRERRAAWLAAATATPSQAAAAATISPVSASTAGSGAETAAILRGFAAATLGRLSESLATASVYAGAASDALGGRDLSRLAGREILQR